MKSLTLAVAAVIQVLGIDATNVARRKAFLEFTAVDVDRLRDLHETLQTLAPNFVDAFYAHLLAFEETRRFLPDAHTIDHLKQTQAAYFNDLTKGDYDQEYIHNRLRVGIVHQRIGLSPEWYIGAYGKYLCGLIPELWKRLGKNHEVFIPACLSLFKIVLLDIGLAIDTYIEADRQTIRSLKEYAEMVFTSIPDGLLVLSSRLVILSANRAFLLRFGLTPAAVQNRYLMDVLAADGLRGRLLEVMVTGVAQHNLSFMMGPAQGGERKPVRITLTGIRLAEEEEEEARLLLIIEDITEEEKLRAAALESERRFRDLAETAHDGIIMTEIDGKIVYFNRAAERMFGYRRNQAIKRSILMLLPDQPISQPSEELRRTPLWESPARRQDGTSFMVEGSSSVFNGSSGRFITYVLRDLTERKQFEYQLVHLANHDPLTNLPNRKFFKERLTAKLNQTILDGHYLAVLFIDLNRFKQINDTFGHAMGDKLLVMVTDRLAGCVRQDDFWPDSAGTSS